MDEKLEKLYSLIYSSLNLNVPVLSGNMAQHIELVEIEPHKIVIKINAPYYDINIWEKEKRIVPVGPINGKSGYAQDVNLHGAWGSNNASKGWINRTLNEACQVIANEYNAILEDKLK